MTDQLAFATGAQAAAHWARLTPEAIAIEEGGTAYSYRTLAMNIARAADVLRSAGLRRGMILGIQCDVHYLHLILILAGETIGAAHLSMAPAELTFGGEHLDRCDLLLVETATEFVAKHPRAIVLSADSAGELTKVQPTPETRAEAEADQPPDDIVRISTTSGTTGRRKFVGHTRRALRHIVASIEFTLNHASESYNYVSMYRFNQWGTYGNSVLALRYGKTIAYCTGANFLTTIHRLKFCHTALLVGDAVRFVVEAPPGNQKVDSCIFRVFGAALSARLRADLRSRLTDTVISAYASNETTDISLIDETGGGTLYPNVAVRIIDEFGQERTSGEPGTIMVRSPCLSSGYLWNEEETRRHFIDGWFRTSDVGVMPEPGRLIVLGRADDMLNLGGIKVAPYPIEELLRSVDGVADAVVLSHVDTYGVEGLHVFIECRDWSGRAAVNQRVEAILRGHFSEAAVHFITRLPRTDSDKVKRAELRARLTRDAPV